MKLQPYPVDRIIDEVMVNVTPLASRGRNRVTVENELGTEDTWMDPLRFRQSLLNLLGNACKFTQGGEVSLTVKRREESGGRWIA